MGRHRRQLVAYVAASVVVALVPAVSAANEQHAPEADASASVKKKVKKLNKKVKLLQQQLEEVSKQSGPQGAAGPQGARGPQGPPGPLSGAAGGDLTGSYPNPSIAPGAVGPPEFGTIPAARAFNSANQTVPSSTPTDLNLDSELFDTANLHTLDSPGNRNLTAPVDGLYQVSAQLQWGFGGTIDGTVFTALIPASNGQLVSDSEAISASVVNTVTNLSGLLQLDAGDTITLRAVHDNSTQATVFGNNGRPALAMHWVGPA